MAIDIKPIQSVMAAPEISVDPTQAIALKDQIAEILPQTKGELSQFLTDISAKIEVNSEYLYTFDAPIRGTDVRGSDILIVDGDQAELISGRVMVGANRPLPVVSCEYDSNKNWTVIRFAPGSLPKDMDKVTFTGPAPIPPAIIEDPPIEIEPPVIVEPETTAFTAPMEPDPQPIDLTAPPLPAPSVTPSLISRIVSFFTGK